MGFFDKLKNGLTKTRESIAKQVNKLTTNFLKILKRHLLWQI